MSYSNPKIYLQDPLAFANSFKESFQAGFQGVEDHIATVRSQVEQKNKALKKTGEDLQDAIEKGKNIVGTFKNKLADEASFYMQSNMAFEKRNEEGGALMNVASARAVGGSSTADMQEAISSFKGLSDGLNSISESLVDPNKYKNTDKSNKNYAKLQSIMDSLRSDPDSLTIEQYGNNFSAYVTYPDVDGEWVGQDGKKYSTISTDVLNAELMNLESIEGFNKQFDDVVGKFKNTIKSGIDRDKEEARKNNQDFFIDGIKRTQEETEPMLRRMYLSEKTRQNTADGPGFFERTFANLGDNVPFDFEPNVEVYGNTQKELFAKTRIGKVIVDEINNAEDRDTIEPLLRAVLDLPLSDKRMDSYISELRKAGLLSKAEVPELYEALQEYQFQVVKEVVDLDVIASGVDSQSVLRKRQRPYSPKDKTETKKYDSERAGVMLREGFLSAVQADRSWGGVGTGAGFTSGQFRIGGKGTPKQIVGTSYDSFTGEITIHYASGRAVGGVKNAEEVSYDTKNPYKMQDMYRDLGDVGNKGFEKEMLKEFDDNGFTSLSKIGMGEWIPWLEKRGYKNKMIDHVAENPQLIVDYPHWRNFFNSNKKSIDAKMLQIAKSNKIK
jgi:hypothetical protein